MVALSLWCGVVSPDGQVSLVKPAERDPSVGKGISGVLDPSSNSEFLIVGRDISRGLKSIEEELSRRIGASPTLLAQARGEQISMSAPGVDGILVIDQGICPLERTCTLLPTQFGKPSHRPEALGMAFDPKPGLLIASLLNQAAPTVVSGWDSGRLGEEDTVLLLLAGDEVRLIGVEASM